MPLALDQELSDRERWRGTEGCPISGVLDLLSTKTSFLVLRECFYGTTRFEDFVDRIESTAPAVSRSLKQLESAGIVARTPYQVPGSRARHEYQLTAAGEDLLPVILSIAQWGGTHLQQGAGPMSLVEAASGRPIRVCVTADGDLANLPSTDIEARAKHGRKSRGTRSRAVKPALRRA